MPQSARHLRILQAPTFPGTSKVSVMCELWALRSQSLYTAIRGSP